MPLRIATAQVSGPETDRIGRPYQFFTVGGPIETERTGIGWHWFGYGYGNWCSLNSTSDFLINWFFIGHGEWHGDWYWNGHSVNVPYSADKGTVRITDEMDMTPLQVSCWRGKFLRRTQSGTHSTIIYIHDEAVRVTDLAVMLLWSCAWLFQCLVIKPWSPQVKSTDWNQNKTYTIKFEPRTCIILGTYCKHNIRRKLTDAVQNSTYM